MNAIFALITILAIVLAVLALLFFKSKKENNTQISQTPTPKKELKQKEIKAEYVFPYRIEFSRRYDDKRTDKKFKHERKAVIHIKNG